MPRCGAADPTVSRGWLVSVACVLMLAVGCSMPFPAPSSGGTSGLSANLQLCVEEINRYRASVGRPPLARSEALEDFAAQAAQHDAMAGVPHQFFLSTNGNGLAKAETELLLWKNYPLRRVIEDGLARMWASGASASHYGVMVGPYSEVGCGVFVNGSETTVAQEYR